MEKETLSYSMKTMYGDILGNKVMALSGSYLTNLSFMKMIQATITLIKLSIQQRRQKVMDMIYIYYTIAPKFRPKS